VGCLQKLLPDWAEALMEHRFIAILLERPFERGAGSDEIAA